MSPAQIEETLRTPAPKTNGISHSIKHNEFPNADNDIHLPSYADLPSVPGMPHGCTWGIWDNIPNLPKYPPPSQLGTLNHLTPATLLAARNEIKAGHWAHQPTKLYYNGVKHADITDPNAPLKNGIDQWSARGGITGRGILLDYYAWSTRNNAASKFTTPPPYPTKPITVADLEAVAAYQGTQIHRGDILLIRCGFIAWYNAAPSAERAENLLSGKYAGVQGSAESVAWFWNKGFAAVGGDACVFEQWPATDETYRLHDNLLALFGMPVGEMFDLERLAEECQKRRKWSFLFMSAPLNFPGGVASPPNGICIL